MVTMIGCQSTDYATPQPSTAGPTTTGALVVNASNAAGITALFQNTAIGSTLAPGAYTPYSQISIGSTQVRVKGSSGTVTSTGDLSSMFTLSPSTTYSFFVTDTISRPKVVSATGTVTDAGGARFLQVVDTLTAPAAGTAKIRFFNLSPDVTGVISSTVAGAASARLINATGASQTTLLNRAYRTASGTTLRYTSVPAGAYTVQVYSGATVPSSTTAAALATAPVTLADGKIYTLYSRGLVRDKTISVGTVQHN